MVLISIDEICRETNLSIDWIELNFEFNSIQFGKIRSNPIQQILLTWILWVELISWKFRKHAHEMVDFFL
jgi:hypothetical protein